MHRGEFEFAWRTRYELRERLNDKGLPGLEL
jgi:hypothetical protein